MNWKISEERFVFVFSCFVSLEGRLLHAFNILYHLYIPFCNNGSLFSLCIALLSHYILPETLHKASGWQSFPMMMHWQEASQHQVSTNNDGVYSYTQRKNTSTVPSFYARKAPIRCVSLKTLISTCFVSADALKSCNGMVA